MATSVAPLWLEVAGPGGLPEGPGDGAAVVVGVGGSGAEVAHGRALVMDLARARGLAAVAVADGAGLRGRLADFAAEPAAAVLRASVLPTDVGGVITDVTRRGRAGVAFRCLARFANGVVHVAVPRPDAVAPLLATLRPLLEARGGGVVVERAGPAVKRGLDVWGDVGPGLALMRRTKATFDPSGILAPGRFVGGL
jgi:FAD/FMN-containing dehydrogenase